MGLFKKLGEKVKRVVSIKNVIGLATGNYLGVAKDAMRVATTNKPKKAVGEPTVLTPDETFLSPTTQLPQVVQDTLITKGAEQTNKMVAKLATNKDVQNAADQSTGFLSKVYLSAMYEKHKTLIWVAGASLVAFVVYWFGFRNKTAQRGRRR
ncbi:hypothetical protein [Flavobacterium sp. M31R6]|uniref:hypothetical protein n=1 Tax=Flavobacterium sp. M31R6 TaxID=2739062 RepID=UPI0015696795|nr:hypothetical protein [Flavobacterium sp. M31R6]QKJ63830.1 hypothetical protein HQN62_12050 [Flavobacterium sp. M31R6]